MCFVGFSACSLAPPDIVEVNVPSDTLDEAGPYLISIKTWGTIDSAYAEWRYEDDEMSSLSTVEFKEIRSDYWEGKLPGSLVNRTILMRVLAEGPGGTGRFPSTGFHRFIVGDVQASCDPVCGDGFLCLNGQCRVSPSCGESELCPSNFDCIDGQCVQRDLCRPSCPEGQSCIGGQCIESTQCDSCPEGQQCQSETGDCVDCLNDQDCNSGLVCDTRQNICVSCIDDADCRPGEICLDSQCEPQTCGADSNEPNDELLDATVIENTDMVRGAICPTDIDYFSIGIELNQPVFNLNDASGPIELTEFDASIGQPLRTITLRPGAALVLSSTTFFLETTDENVEYMFDISAQPMMCDDDVLEPDDTPESATTIGASGARIAAQLCPSNTDWYEIRQRRRDRAGIVLLKTELPGIEAEISQINAGPAEVISLGRDTGSPWLSIDYPDVDENLFVQLILAGNARSGGRYWIATKSATQQSCADDQFEPNDNSQQAFELPPEGNFIGQARTVCAQSEDWFSLPKTESESVTFSIEFDNARGDIDLLVYDSDSNLVGFDINGADGHSVELPSQFTAGNYQVRVVLFGQGQNQYIYQVERTE